MSYSFTPKTREIIYETLPHRLKYFADITPDKVACIFLYPGEERKQLTYKEIYTKCTLFAKGLKHLSIKEGDIVGLGILNEPEWIISTFGCQMIGAVPLHFMFQRKDGTDVLRILEVVENCTALVCDPGHNNSNIEILKTFITLYSDGIVSCQSIPSLKYLFSTKIYDADKKPVTVDDIMGLGELNKTCSLEMPIVSPDSTAAIVLSSGSTGAPKAIPHSHYSLLMMGYHFKIALGLTANDVYFNDKTFNWIGGYPHEMLYCGLTRVTVHSRTSFKTFKEINHFLVKVIDSECVTSALMIAPCLYDMVVGGIPDCKRLPLKCVGTGGRPVTSSNILSCAGTLCETLVVLYGSTEIGFVSAKPLKEGQNFDDYDVGTPLPGVEIKIVNEKEQVVPPGETGEIYIRHPVIFQGYLNEPGKTNRVFTSSGWYKSDDVGRMSKEMNFFAFGRKAGTVLIAGQVISVSYVESAIKAHPFVYDTLVFPVEKDELSHQVCAAVVLMPDCHLSADQITDFLSDQYTSERSNISTIGIVPKYILFFDSFPKTFNDKVNHRGVLNMVSERLQEEYP